MFEDSLGRLWVGNEGGLAVRDTSGSWHKLGREDGFTARQVFFLGQDREGTIWVGVEHGVLRLLPDGRVRPFTTEDGLAGMETNQFGFYAGAGGEVWLGTVSGLTRYDPSHRAPQVALPPVIVESAELPQRRVDFPSAGPALERTFGHLSRRASDLPRPRPGRLPCPVRGARRGWLPPRRSLSCATRTCPRAPTRCWSRQSETTEGSGRPCACRFGWCRRCGGRAGFRAAWWRSSRSQPPSATGSGCTCCAAGRRSSRGSSRRALRSCDEPTGSSAAGLTDALTELPNRRAVLERLRDQLERGSRRLGCLLITWTASSRSTTPWSCGR